MKNIFPYLVVGRAGKNDWWRYIIGILLVLAASNILGYIPVELYMDSADTSNLSKTEIYQYQTDLNFEKLGLSNNIGLVVLISGFLLGLIMLFLVQKYIHKRPIVTLFSSMPKVRWKRLFLGALIWGTLIIIQLILSLYFFTSDYHFQFDESKFLPLLLISIFLLPIQTGFEELFFRGYFMQALGNIIKYPIIVVMITSLLFSLAHGFNPEVTAFGASKMMLYYFGFALMAALVTLLDDGIELALGMHTINNILTALTVAEENAVIKTDAIWKVSNVNITWWNIIVYYLMFALFIGGVYLIIWRKNKAQA